MPHNAQPEGFEAKVCSHRDGPGSCDGPTVDLGDGTFMCMDHLSKQEYPEDEKDPELLAAAGRIAVEDPNVVKARDLVKDIKLPDELRESIVDLLANAFRTLHDEIATEMEFGERADGS
jgi:hypothetical protein